jgi:Ca-activated chloride channel family protein
LRAIPYTLKQDSNLKDSHMALAPKKGSLLLAALLFGTFGLHALYQARAQTETPSGGSTLTDPSRFGETAASAPPVRAGDGKVRLTATADRSAVMQNGDGVVHVEVTIEPEPASGPAPRTPTDLVVIMDHSGSMHGDKLEQAKLALFGLIERVDARDRLGVVIFDDTAQVLFPLEAPAGAAREAWRARVRAVESAGGTSISSGLDAGIGLLSAPSPDRVTRVLLLSDGQDSTPLEQLTLRARRLQAKHGVLSAVGIGQDFEEKVMTSLASAGTGAFYYLAKPEVLASLLDAELKTATETYASGAELRLRAADGVRVSSAGGVPLTTEGEEAVVSIGSLYAGRARKVWLTLSLPTDGSGERALGELALRYRRAGETFVVGGGALPAIAAVADPGRFEAAINPEVWGRAMLEEELNRASEELGDAIARGTAADVDSSVQRIELSRPLAAKLGQQLVVAEIEKLRTHGAAAKQAQQAAPAERNLAAKRQKATGYGKRNAGAYGATDFAVGF